MKYVLYLTLTISTGTIDITRTGYSLESCSTVLENTLAYFTKETDYAILSIQCNTVTDI